MSKINKILIQDINKFCESIDIKYQTEFVKNYSLIGDSWHYGGKHSGSDGEHQGAEFIAEELHKIGLENIEFVPTSTTKFQFNDANIKVITPVDVGEELFIKPYAYVAPGTSPYGMDALLMDVGTSKKDFYASNDVKGKIALIEAMGVLEGTQLTAQMQEAILHGAVGIIIYAVEDILDDDTVRVQPPNILSTVPIVGINLRHANYLRTLLAEKGELMIHLQVDVDFRPNEGITYNVVGEIPGAFSDERIIYSSHLDHYFRCLQDNISSCSTLLGIAKAIKKSGYKPKRTLTFVFHGSHECGLVDSKYPYIYGSYQLIHDKKREWIGKTIANINFEYTALKLDDLAVLTSVGNEQAVYSYFDYMPIIDKGFKHVRKSVNLSDYYILSWVDAISYFTAGIPVYGNDIITEQINTGNSPYVGRDHSNRDDWDVFDKEALEATSRFYGGLGLYLDSTPFMEINFSRQAERIRMESNFDQLRKYSQNAVELMGAVEEIDHAGTLLLETAQQKNCDYIEALSKGMSEDEQKKYFQNALDQNTSILRCFDLLQRSLDKIGPSDFLYIGNAKYTDNILMMEEAISYLENGNPRDALKKLMGVDLGAVSYNFSKEVVAHMQKQINDPAFEDRRTWARGKELSCLTLYTLMQLLKARQCEENAEFGEEIKLIEDAISSEASMIPKILDEEIRGINKAVAEINLLISKLQK